MPTKFSPNYEITHIELSQMEDTSGRVDCDIQTLSIDFIDSGSGYYAVLNTERWALDLQANEFAHIGQLCDDIVAHNDQILRLKEDAF